MIPSRIAATIALGLALVVPRQAARALTPVSTYDYCGESGFTLCASGHVSVVQDGGGVYSLAMSGWHPVQLTFATLAVRQAYLDNVKPNEHLEDKCERGIPSRACVSLDDPIPAVTATPEPGSMILVATGIAALGAYRRRRKMAAA